MSNANNYPGQGNYFSAITVGNGLRPTHPRLIAGGQIRVVQYSLLIGVRRFKLSPQINQGGGK